MGSIKDFDIIDGDMVIKGDLDVFKIRKSRAGRQQMWINGDEVDSVIAQEITSIHVTGNVKTVDSQGRVEVGGDVTGNVNTQGSVSIKGNVGGHVDTQGSVTCGNVGRGVNTMGRVECGTVGGNVNTMGKVIIKNE